MLFKWFDAREATEFGISMAKFFAQRVPADSIPATEEKPLRRAAEVVAKLQTQAQNFRAGRRLNIYKKAKLANAFQWTLFDLGYHKKIVEELTKEMLMCL